MASRVASASTLHHHYKHAAAMAHPAPTAAVAAASTTATTTTTGVGGVVEPQNPRGQQQQQQIQVPNRFTTAFHEMKKICPNSISNYANCVINAENAPDGSTLTKHLCSKEFRQVKECFRKVRGYP